MVIVTGQDMLNWENQNVHTKIGEWFMANSGKWISDFLADPANTGITYQQVAWALAFHANHMTMDLMALPTSDTELSLAMQMNQMYKG